MKKVFLLALLLTIGVFSTNKQVVAGESTQLMLYTGTWSPAQLTYFYSPSTMRFVIKSGNKEAETNDFWYKCIF